MHRTARALVLTAALVLAGCTDDTAGPQPSAAPSTQSTSAAATPSASAVPTTSPAADLRVIKISVAGGKVTRDDRRVDVRKGEKVRIEVTADVTDEVHLHGYDIHDAVAPGAPAALEFTATISGQFETELEKSKLLLVVIAVR